MKHLFEGSGKQMMIRWLGKKNKILRATKPMMNFPVFSSKVLRQDSRQPDFGSEHQDVDQRDKSSIF